MRTVPFRRVISRSAWRYPGAGATVPMFPHTGSTMTAARSFPWAATTASTAATSLNGTTSVSATVPAGTPGEPGMPRVATPEPAETSSESAWPW